MGGEEEEEEEEEAQKKIYQKNFKWQTLMGEGRDD